MLLLDTHALIWWFNQTPNKLTDHHVDLIESAPRLAVSVMTAWEITWLALHQRISLPITVADW